MTFDSKEYLKKWRKNNKERKSEMDKEYYQKNKEKIKKNSKKRYYLKREECKNQCKKYYQKNKEKRKQYIKQCFDDNYSLLTNKGLITDCIICGFPKEKFAAIDFHHINPEEKEKQMSPLIHNPVSQGLLEEARKCVCMCRNCHSLYHAGDEEVIEKFNEYTNRKKEV